jgi:hypothetical protein
MVSVVTVHLNSVMSSAVLMASAKHTCVHVCVAWCWHVPFFMQMAESQISSSLGILCGATTRTATQIQV